MQIAMITCRREPSYVAKSVDSFFETSEGKRTLLLYTDGNADEALALARAWAPAVRVEGQDAEELKLASSKSPKIRALRNFARALRDGDGSLLLLEDDIVFKHGWTQALEETIAGCGRDSFISLYAHPRVVEALCATGDLAVTPKPGEGPWLARTIAGNLFYGTLAIYIPRAWRQALSRAIDRDLRFAPHPAPFDTNLAAFAYGRNLPINVTVPSYVDHIGEVSTIPENADKGPRKSPLF